MKKKMKARDLREAKKAEKQAEIKAKSEQTAAKAAEAVKAESPIASNSTKQKSKKTANKAAGLKSTLVNGSDIYLTSFGKGNTAVLEHRIATDNNYSVDTIGTPPTLDVKKADEIDVSFSSSRPTFVQRELSAVNPLHSGKKNKDARAGSDMLGLKDELEKRYFGKTFDDNIHIQIAYNILDIEKIMAVYSANITAALDHMIDEDNEQYLKGDFIGYMNTFNTYEVFMDPSKDSKLKDNDRENIKKSREKFEKLLSTKRLGYFGFEIDSKDKDKNDKTKKQLYHLIAFAGQFRQWSFHSQNEKWLYYLENPKIAQEYRDTLDVLFDKRFKDIHNDFIEKNKVNLHILRKEFPDFNISELEELYYDFIVVKSYKNMGFSIKKLREKMLTFDTSKRILSEETDSIRPKLYKLIDFCIFYDYYKDEERCKRNVDTLRATLTEEQKEDFYTNEGEFLWAKHGKRFLHFRDITEAEAKNEKNIKIPNNDLTEAYRKNSNISYFSKLMYAMCLFLDGKEINDLLTTLINKFDNIASFIETANTLNIDCTFVKEYSFFNSCKDYVHELNIVKNIARMQKPTVEAEEAMFCDALTILGIPDDMTDEKLDNEIKNLFTEKKGSDETKGEKVNTPFGNFIKNNVIRNTRFIYVIKFCNPQNVREIVNNIALTKFVLNRIPEAQIDRYYNSCVEFPDKYAGTTAKINKLAEMMHDMDFSEFRGVQQKPKNPKENKEKERFKAIIGLYLTVVYQVVKNLVNVNARYVMAFHSLERDSKLYNIDTKSGYLALTEQLCAEGENSRSQHLARNNRLRGCVQQDIDNARKYLVGENFDIIKRYRNNVAHLTAVRNCSDYIGDISKIDSYFALYHYLIQRQLAKGLDPTRPNFETNFPYYAQLYKWNTYVKDFVKALNSPFGYNIPRFKALTINELFDRNEMEKKAEQLDKKRKLCYN